MYLRLASKSLLNRKGSVLLALLAITVSLFVLIGVEHIRQQARNSFSSTISGVDLLVGARTGPINLLLYTVFHIGAPTNNIRWETYKNITENSKIRWSVPLSLGDSHKGFRVIGTNQDYFTYFRYGHQRPLEFNTGTTFHQIFDVVLGAEVAAKLGYTTHDQIILAHGIAAKSFTQHDQFPFTVTGILKRTGTPVDQSLYVNLQGLEAIHMSKNALGNPDTVSLQSEHVQPSVITAFIIGLESRITTFQVQQAINDYTYEPLSAVLPGVVLTELWATMGSMESILKLISILVFVAALLGLSALLLASVRERRHEIKLLRVIGAPAWFLFVLIQVETIVVLFISFALSVGIMIGFLWTFEDLLMSEFGIYLNAWTLQPGTLWMLFIIISLSMVAASIPAFSAYRTAKTT